MRFPMAVTMNRRARGSREPLLDAVDLRRAFCVALRDYAEAAGTTGQPRLLEAIIRTSRGVANDHSEMCRADRQIIHSILDRYRALHPHHLNLDVSTHAEAHSALQLLFF
jgi:hypothetical protein